jgi:uncharacterized integral membrane protein
MDQDRRNELTRIGIVVVVVGLLVWFALANSQSVSVDFLVTTHSARLIVVIVISAVLGAIAGQLVARRRRR